jgi:hypothetical protein
MIVRSAEGATLPETVSIRISGATIRQFPLIVFLPLINSAEWSFESVTTLSVPETCHRPAMRG